MKKQINNLDQIAYIRCYTLSNGQSDGIKVVEIYNGNLRILLNESKALDIMQLFSFGVNISYLSKNGFTKRETSFLKRFEGGMLYTCGIDVVGKVTGYEDHGSFHNIPACVTHAEICKEKIIVEADIHDSELFGKNLIMKRRYETQIGSNYIELFDTLVNCGYRDEKYSLLYHTNVGYPMLDKDCKIIADVKDISPRTAFAKDNIDKAFIIESPKDNAEETCYFLNLKSNKISVINERLNKKLTISYSDNLPYFVQWKSMASGDYALGLEPSTTLLDDKFVFSTIKAQQEISYSLKIEVK